MRRWTTLHLPTLQERSLCCSPMMWWTIYDPGGYWRHEVKREARSTVRSKTQEASMTPYQGKVDNMNHMSSMTQNTTGIHNIVQYHRVPVRLKMKERLGLTRLLDNSTNEVHRDMYNKTGNRGGELELCPNSNKYCSGVQAVRGICIDCKFLVYKNLKLQRQWLADERATSAL